MRRIVLILLIGFLGNTVAQDVGGLVSNPHFSLHGGLNFISVKDGWGTFMLEGKTKLTNNLLLKLSFGYTNLSSNNKYEVKSYSFRNIDNIRAYSAISYYVNKIDYELIPISIGIQYNINHSRYNPYILTEVGYNLIDPVTHKSNTVIINEYNSYEELPAEYRNTDFLPNGSYKLAIGFGINYQLSSVFAFDVRYVNSVDSEIINSQQILIGVSF